MSDKNGRFCKQNIEKLSLPFLMTLDYVEIYLFITEKVNELVTKCNQLEEKVEDHLTAQGMFNSNIKGKIVDIEKKMSTKQETTHGVEANKSTSIPDYARKQREEFGFDDFGAPNNNWEEDLKWMDWDYETIIHYIKEHFIEKEELKKKIEEVCKPYKIYVPILKVLKLLEDDD